MIFYMLFRLFPVFADIENVMLRKEKSEKNIFLWNWWAVKPIKMCYVTLFLFEISRFTKGIKQCRNFCKAFFLSEIFNNMYIGILNRFFYIYRYLSPSKIPLKYGMHQPQGV